MIILHNSLDKESRDFLSTTITELGTTLDSFVNGVADTADNNHTVYDWYLGGREAFWDTGNTHKVSAFPSVIIDIPSHRTPPIPFPTAGGPPIPVRNIPREQHALRKPTDLMAIQSSLDEINIRLSKSAAHGKSVPALTLASISNRKT